MAEQVITIDENGCMESLRQKKGQGVDLREFGAVEMERVSEVILDTQSQKYYVHFILGILADRILSEGLYHNLKGDEYFLKHSRKIKYFDDYEDAVEAEIFVLNAFQKDDKVIAAEALDLICPRKNR